MHEALKRKIIDKVPDVVETILRNSEDIYTPNIRETMCFYAPSGSLISKDVFFIYDTEMIRHVEHAHKKGFSITVSDSVITIRRECSNGEYYLVDYRPISA